MARWLMSLVMLAIWLMVPATMAQEPRGRNWGRHEWREFDSDPDLVEDRIDQRIDRYISTYKSVYDLNEEQVELVSGRLEELRGKELEHMETHREQRQKLGSELRELFKKRRDGEEVDKERMGELMEGLSRMRRSSPLMSRENTTEAIEKLLPADQVAKGRKRQEERNRKLEQRRDEMRWLRKVEQGLRADPTEKDSWDRYVEGFVRMFQLDDSQQSTAGTILRTYKQRRAAYRESRRDEYKTLLALEDHKERDKKMEELRRTADGLFDKLKIQLDRIPTSAQKSLVSRLSRKSVQTQPAESATQPADTASQPAKVRTALRPAE